MRALYAFLLLAVLSSAHAKTLAEGMDMALTQMRPGVEVPPGVGILVGDGRYCAKVVDDRYAMDYVYGWEHDSKDLYVITVDVQGGKVKAVSRGCGASPSILMVVTREAAEAVLNAQDPYAEMGVQAQRSGIAWRTRSYESLMRAITIASAAPFLEAFVPGFAKISPIFRAFAG